MEMEEGTIGDEVEGRVFHFNKGAAFFKTDRNGEEVICLFRPNKLFVDGRKLGASNFKSVETISKILRVGDMVTGLVVPCNEGMVYQVENAESGEKYSIVPTFYATAIWKGEKPSDKNGKQGAGPPSSEQEIKIENVKGKIILNQLASGTGRGLAGPSAIAFKNLDGQDDLAMFRNPRYFYINGVKIKPKVYKSWAKNHQIEVTFDAVFTPGLKEFTAKMASPGNEDKTAMDVDMKLKPNWRAMLVWVGEKPSQNAPRGDQQSGQEVTDTSGKMSKDAFLESIHGYEYASGRLEVILDKRRGILNWRNNYILFTVDQVSIDGRDLTDSDNLLSVLNIGEVLYCYVKPREPFCLEDCPEYQIAFEVSQVWKGKREMTGADQEIQERKSRRAKRNPIPLPAEATHFNVSGVVSEICSPGLGYVKLVNHSRELDGNVVLFSRNRLYINGTKLRFKEILSDNVGVGDIISFDMIRANPEESGSVYDWVAVLAWMGSPPNKKEVNSEISNKAENYRAKIVLLEEEKDDSKIAVRGVLQIIGGHSKIGERVIFYRENTYVFGACMARADLACILKINDKVQLEMENLQSPVTKFGVTISYLASLVWIGPAPKMDENVFEFPHHVGPVINPFLKKRGLSEMEFTRIIQGDTGPGRFGGKSGSPTTANAGTLDKAPNIQLPPKTIYGKVIELRKPENMEGGTEHAIFLIENGPHQNEKAFLSRDSLYCWGYHCYKADLMYLILENDRFCVEVQDGTNNKVVPYRITTAWIGPHPHEHNKRNAAMMGNPLFRKWLKEHNLTKDQFIEVVEGQAQPSPFFPFPSEPLSARLAYFLPPRHQGLGGGADAGVLRLCPNSKDGSRKGSDVLFERDSVYIWNVPILKGDLQYLISENDKLFVEVTDLLGKDKKRWQTRLGTPNVPKLVASLVYIGGGRPKPDKVSADNNSNLGQWLKKRGLDLTFFKGIINGELMPKTGADAGEDVFSSAYSNGTMKEASPFNNPALHNSQMGSNMPGAPNFSSMQPNTMAGTSYRANVLNKALTLTQRTMTLFSPEDPDVRMLIQDDSDAQIALFLSKTMTNAVMMYRSGGGVPGPIGPPGNLGPIGPPRGGGAGRSRPGELNEFYADPGMSRGVFAGRAEGLYGLSQPLLDYKGTQNFQANSNNLEPPYKRKFDDW